MQQPGAPALDFKKRTDGARRRDGWRVDGWREAADGCRDATDGATRWTDRSTRRMELRDGWKAPVFARVARGRGGGSGRVVRTVAQLDQFADHLIQVVAASSAHGRETNLESALIVHLVGDARKAEGQSLDMKAHFGLCLEPHIAYAEKAHQATGQAEIDDVAPKDAVIAGQSQGRGGISRLHAEDFFGGFERRALRNEKQFEFGLRGFWNSFFGLRIMIGWGCLGRMLELKNRIVAAVGNNLGHRFFHDVRSTVVDEAGQESGQLIFGVSAGVAKVNSEKMLSAHPLYTTPDAEHHFKYRERNFNRLQGSAREGHRRANAATGEADIDHLARDSGPFVNKASSDVVEVESICGSTVAAFGLFGRRHRCVAWTLLASCCDISLRPQGRASASVRYQRLGQVCRVSSF